MGIGKRSKAKGPEDPVRALRQAEERLRTMLELSSDWYWEQDENCLFTQATGTSTEQMGVITQQYVGTARWDHGGIPVGDDGSWDKHKAVLKARQPFANFIFKRPNPEGGWSYISVTGKPVFDEQERFQGYRGTARDITEQKRAEEALRQSEARFRSLTRLSSDLYWEQDDHYRFTSFAGTGSERVTNVRGFNFVGKKHWELDYLNMSAVEWSAHMAILDARQPFHDLELCRLDESGKKIWIGVSGEPMFDETGVFKGYRGVGKDISARKQAEERIQYLAHHDGLTALPNRTLFSELLSLAIRQSKRYGHKFAVLFIDLDRFKLINDTLGHDAGDVLLREVSRRLTETLRSSDVMARLGGDEFVVMVHEVGAPRQVEAVARKIMAAVIKPITIQGQECRVTASIGISMYPADADDEQSLMKNADTAMYCAKEEGKNTFRFYTGGMSAHSFERLAMESSLRRAFESEAFYLHYQAKHNRKSGAITGVEVLLRWSHPELGLVAPTQVIPIMEESGLIVPVGRWALGTACAQNVAWQRLGLPPVTVAVNLSSRQFFDQNLLQDIADALEESGLAPELLEFELTETMVMKNAERAATVLAAMKKLGVRLTIDDFGIGFASLAHQKRFCVDTMKVDRSFIRDLSQDSEDRAITQAIVTMGKSLQLNVVVEGVETEEQMAFLQSGACDEMQGFYFSHPIESDQFAELLRRNAASQLTAISSGRA